MSYKALVCRISVRKIDGLDNLVLGTCRGYQVLVGKEVNEGELGLFFEQGGQLSEQFARANDLIRRKNPDGTRAGGMFEENRRVKAIKIRGVRSEGFWTPLNSLNAAGIGSEEFDPYRVLSDGDEIDSFNGVPICQKYETPATIRAAQGQGGGKSSNVRRETRWFKKHKDTEDVRRNSHEIAPGSIITITEKLHGCVHYNTRIRMADGSDRKIVEVNPGDEVLGVDEGGRIVPSKVLKRFSGGDGNWVNVKFTRSGSGHPYGRVCCTDIHPFFVQSLNGFVQAKNLRVGDVVLQYRRVLNITSVQREVLLGKLLGDGTFVERCGTAKVEFCHVEDDAEYLGYCRWLLGDLIHPTVSVRTSGYGSTMLRAATRHNHFVKDEFADLKPRDGRRTVPDWVAQDITPLSIAIWYMDDGSLAHSEGQNDRANLAICRYDESSWPNISACFEKFGITPTFYRDTKGYARIRFNLDEANKLFELIWRYVPESMHRKLPAEYRDRLANQPQIIGVHESNHAEFITVQQRVLSVEPVEVRNSKRHDMETSTHNYFANDVLVHNTSTRNAFVLAEKPRTFWDRLLRRPTKTEFTYMTGSRNVILRDPSETRYYGKENFRYEVTNRFRGKLRHGEVLYGELVGFTDTGSPIMPSHTPANADEKRMFGETLNYAYGANPETGETRFFVYRIVQTTVGGDQIELSWAQLRARCVELGVDYVPHLEGPFIVPDNLADDDLQKWIGSTLMGKIRYFAEGPGGTFLPSSIDVKTPREGVVIRVDQPSGRTVWLKHKGWAFKLAEGIVKESDSYVDTEEAA